MSTKAPGKPSPPRRIFRVRNLLIGLLLLLIVGYLAVPRRVRDVVSVDGLYRWAEDEAPPRYKIVWQEAEKVDAPAVDLGDRASLIRPQLAEDGTALYFTLRKPEGDADVYRSELVDGAWQPAEPVGQLNTSADDVGPVFRAGGSKLYLYSDREGGHGGFDLYVAEKTTEGWSQPRNLGPRINSPAHEYDPAVSADGRRLLFASNRTPRMGRKMAESETGELPQRWSTTLRADLGLTNFDLYMSGREADHRPWGFAEPLEELNLPNSNEGAPYISPQGTFVYFVSDRIGRDVEEINFDVYRARIRGDRVFDVESLGSGVNTAANEIEPALSIEGYNLYFSRNETAPPGATPGERVALEDRYALYRSEATEVVEEYNWGRSPAASLVMFLIRNAWWVLLILLTLALLAALIWYIREVSLRRLPVPGFLLAALVFHALFVLGLFQVGIADRVIAMVRKRFDEMLVATRMSDDLHQSHVPGQEAYEKIADLAAIDMVQPADVIRRVTEMPNVPVPTESPAVEIPALLARRMPPDRLVALPPEATVRTEAPKLVHRRPRLEHALEEMVDLERPEAVEQARQKEIEQMRVELDRRQPVTAVANLPRLNSRRPVEVAMHVEPVEITAERDARQPDPTSSAQVPQPTIERNRVADASVESGPIETEPVVAPAATSRAASGVLPAPEESAVAPDRREPIGSVMPRRDVFRPRKATDPGLQLTRVEMTVPTLSWPGETPTVVSTDASAVSVSRHRVSLSLATESPEQIEVSEVTGPSSPAARQAHQILGADVQVEHRAEAAPTPDRTVVQLTGLNRPAGLPGMAPSDAEQPTRPGDAAPSSVPEHVRPNLNRRRAPSAIGDDAEPEPIASEQLSAAPAASPGKAPKTSITGMDVGVDRPEAKLVRVDVKTAGRLGGRHNPRDPSLVVGSLEKEAVDAPPSFSPIASRIVRRPAKAPTLMYAEDNIGLQAMFRARRDQEKGELIEAFGGRPDETLDAVRRGLEWLRKHQHNEGYWSLHQFYNQEKGKSYPGQGSAKSDAAATGFGLLPFLGDGHTPNSGKHSATVRKGVDWLIKRQKDNGDLAEGSGGNSHMYSHAIAAIALCEAYGMSKDPQLHLPAQKSIDFIVWAQHKPSGGWRYKPNEQADTSVVGWQVMALKSGQMAALDVPVQSLELVHKWLDHVEGKGNKMGRFGYQNANVSPAMTAEGLLCLQYLGTDRNDPRLQSGVKYLLEHLPMKDKESSYYWYYGTQVMFHLQGEPWKKWNDALAQMLIDSQAKEGHLSGTWNTKMKWEDQGGRIYSTSLRLLMLEVYYRHLPLYQIEK